jgi:tRNA A-37 threonylcarbamoyl transferase component Bud32
MRSVRHILSPFPGKEGRVSFWITPDLQGVRGELSSVSERGIRDDPETLTIKKNRHRAVYRTRLRFLEKPVLVKSFYTPKFSRVLKGLFVSEGARELAHALAATERGIPIAAPLFLLERRKGPKILECLLAYRYLEGISLYDYLAQEKDLPPDRLQSLMLKAGELTALLHDQGGIHRDYHAGNILILSDESMVVLDLYPLTFVKQIREKDRIEGLAHLVASLLPQIGEEGIRELIEGYRKTSFVPLGEKAEEGIMRQQQILKRRHEASRSKRCMKNSSSFYQFRGRGVRIAAKRELPVEKILSILEAFDRKFQTRPTDALKNAPESVILRLNDIWDVPLCIKWYRKRGRADRVKEWVRGGRVLRAWKAGNRLLARGIPVATPYAMVKTTRGGFLFMEAVEGLELDRFLSRAFVEGGTEALREKWKLAEALGHLIGKLHHKGIYHADLKACNMMVMTEGEAWRIKLLDYDSVRFFKNLPEGLRVKNLVQLNTSIPVDVSRCVRYRFLHAYRVACPEVSSEKKLFRWVWKGSKDKSILYVTDSGDRIASWRR